MSARSAPLLLPPNSHELRDRTSAFYERDRQLASPADDDLPASGVDVSPAQRRELTATEACIRGDADDLGVLSIFARSSRDLGRGEGRAGSISMLAVGQGARQSLDVLRRVETSAAASGSRRRSGVLRRIRRQRVSARGRSVVEDRAVSWRPFVTVRGATPVSAIERSRSSISRVVTPRAGRSPRAAMIRPEEEPRPRR